MTGRSDSDSPHNNGSPDEAELLLPWYVSGNLSDEDRARVDAWLARTPGASAHLKRVRNERALVFADSETLGHPADDMLDQVMRKVGSARLGVGLVQLLRARRSPRFALAAIAALGIIVIGQSAALLGMNWRRSPALMNSALHAKSAQHREALVAFAPGLAVDVLAGKLRVLGLAIVGGPEPDGIFVIDAPDTEAGKKALATLASGTDVTFFQEQNKG